MRGEDYCFNFTGKLRDGKLHFRLHMQVRPPRSRWDCARLAQQQGPLVAAPGVLSDNKSTLTVVALIWQPTCCLVQWAHPALARL